MSTSEFPGNSKNPKPASEPRKIESVVTSQVVPKKKSLGKRFKEVFIGGNSRNVANYVIMDVLVPQAKDMIVEAAQQAFERMIYGESRPSSRNRYGTRPDRVPTNYNRLSSRGNNPIGRSGREERGTAYVSVRSQNGIDDILLATRPEAELVLERMDDLLREYESASVADLYSLIDWSSSHTDHKWGWTDLTDARIDRVRDGYILNLPKPLPLD